ncbi:hypothetical protein PVK06_035776 [Gossypium arboreum]|uniref:Amino acid transporter transmembrane domain-containing protein n=1 Tax=Gossypium arboreum TaxID=29729 RepID=A0ABR0NHP2_GOSAR|nr:hypothetical protein PVK06_035776 [Gossypium arboreum]
MALPATIKVLGLVLVSCKARSYREVVQIAMGRIARVLSEICIIVNNTGVLIVYLIIMGDVMSGSVRHIGVLDQWLGLVFGIIGSYWFWLLWLFFLAPLYVLDKIDSLSMTSAASVALAVVFVVVCFAVAFIKLIEGKIEALRMSPYFGSKMEILDLLVVIPIMTNAYVFHFNVQPIYNELEGRSPPQKMNQVGRITIALCVVVYA